MVCNMESPLEGVTFWCVTVDVSGDLMDVTG